MVVDQNKLLTGHIKKLLRRGADDHIQKIINKTHAADLAAVVQFLLPGEQKSFFGRFKETKQKAILFSELEDDLILRLIEDMPVVEIAEVLEQMPNDDVADLLGKIPRDQAKALLTHFADESAEGVEALLKYDPKTAGGIMVPDVIALKEKTSAREAVEILQKEYADIEMPFYLYVVNDYGHLIGDVFPEILCSLFALGNHLCCMPQ